MFPASGAVAESGVVPEHDYRLSATTTITINYELPNVSSFVRRTK